jgi:predicted ArsR family transcriptional regulator
VTARQRNLLRLIAKQHHRGMTCWELAREAGISRSTASNDLTALVRADLVERNAAAGAVGRPRYEYRTVGAGTLTTANLAGVVINDLLQFVADGNPGVIRAAWSCVWGRGAARSQASPDDASLRVSVMRVAETFEDLGFLPVVTSVVPEEVRLAIRACPMATLARRESFLCLAEQRFVSLALPNAQVSVTSNLANGQDECCYRVRTQSP